MFLLLTTCVFFSCKKQEFILNSGIKLEFSTDTILFDTVFVTAGSITKRVKIFNRSKQNILINEIYLGGKRINGKSAYRLNINGFAQNQVEEIELAAEDSLYIFAEVTINPNQDSLPFIVSDSIVFNTGNNKIQKVYLDAYGQNAIFYNNEQLPCNTVWDNALPIVVYNSVLVPGNCDLTIRAGTNIYFNSGSFLFVQGTLKVEGNVDNPVTFQGDRLDEFYKDVAGGWGGIHFLRNSINNEINFAEIKNALIGIRVDSLSNNALPNLRIQNTIISNMVLVGLLGYTAEIDAQNLLITDCGRFTFAGLLGGKYDLRHCTISNLSFEFSRNEPSFVVSNADLLDDEDNFIRSNDLDATITNCILWGDRDEEIILDNSGRGAYSVVLSHNLVKTQEVSLFDNSHIINRDPKFKNAREFDYQIDTLSPIFRKGIDLIPMFPSLAKDLGNQNRAVPPTIGCFERIE